MIFSRFFIALFCMLALTFTPVRSSAVEDLDKKFARATATVKGLPKEPAQPVPIQLEFYGNFKRATAGKYEGKKPGLLDLKGWAWVRASGKTSNQAKRDYIAMLDELHPGWDMM
jgi:diazepam-binding inhibitor (GABA receptor modulator, acyl-CoA-binding protein)